MNLRQENTAITLRKIKDTTLDKCIYELWQEDDCCSPVDVGQKLRIEIEDGGGGPYVVISTNRWAIDENDLENLPKLLHDILYQYEEYNKE